MRKILLILIIGFAFAFTACNNGNGSSTTAHTHQWGEWEETTVPTCTEAGEKTRTCKLDPTHIETQTVDAHGHNWNIDYEVIAVATETTDGIKAITCKHNKAHTRDEEFSGEYATGTTGLIFTLINDNTEYRVEKGTVESGMVHIPAYWRGNSTDYADYKPVTEISNGTDVWENGAFGGTISSPNTAITSVTFAENSQLKTINGHAFFSCTSLTSITIPVSVTSIGTYAFFNCASLSSITIPTNITSIDYGTFAWCRSLTSITIHTSITSIGGQAFIDTGLTEITIPESVTTIGAQVFSNSRNLTSIMVDANNQHYTSEGGVLYNKEKTILMAAPPAGINGSVTIPASVTIIDSSAFLSCTSITSITIPAGVTVRSSAFQNWTPSQTINIEGYASESEADTAWGADWRTYCNAVIRYWNGSTWV